MIRQLLFLLCAVGALLLGWWPLVALVIIVSALDGHWSVAIFLGLFFDLLYGPPVGLLHNVLLPFTFLAILCLLARVGFMKLLRRESPRTL
jgi:hypothetical protein